MLKLAKITTLNNDSIRVTFRGETVESHINWHILSGYTPTINDLVVVDEKLKIILGRVI